jgi:ribosomal protein L27
MGKDHTLFALSEGHVWFRWVKRNEKMVSEVSIRGEPKGPKVDIAPPL